MRLLVVEDDPGMSDLLRRALRGQGYGVDLAGTGEQALDLVELNDYDAIVLDVLIPAPDGFGVLLRIRQDGHTAPVLMLTALDGVEDRVAGLDWGADDYLTKPFELTELFARLRALTRRGPTLRRPELRCADLVLDPARHTVHRGGTAVDLSTTEFSLLHEFMRHPGVVLSRSHLLEHVWDPAADHQSNIVDVYVSYLRLKIDQPWGVRSLQTVRGKGYRLDPDAGPCTGTGRDDEPVPEAAAELAPRHGSAAELAPRHGTAGNTAMTRSANAGSRLDGV